MSMHKWFGRHHADTKNSHWEQGVFVSACTTCGEKMVKMPGLEWSLKTNAK
jgi:hypothetical protein